MAANTATHSFANITPVSLMWYTAKRDGANGHVQVMFECHGPRNRTGAMGHYRFTVTFTAAQLAKLANETALLVK